jgi:hypothetical protein
MRSRCAAHARLFATFSFDTSDSESLVDHGQLLIQSYTEASTCQLD